MCSAFKLGKSRRISDSDIPLAMYSRTSETVIRVPTMQGLPLRTPEVTVVRTWPPARDAARKGWALGSDGPPGI